MLRNACEDARAATHKDLADCCSKSRKRELAVQLRDSSLRHRNKPGQQSHVKPMTILLVQGELDKIKSAVMAVYPTGLPPYDEVFRILNDTEGPGLRLAGKNSEMAEREAELGLRERTMNGTVQPTVGWNWKLLPRAKTLIECGLGCFAGQELLCMFEPVWLVCYEIQKQGGGTHFTGKSDRDKFEEQSEYDEILHEEIQSKAGGCDEELCQRHGLGARMISLAQVRDGLIAPWESLDLEMPSAEFYAAVRHKCEPWAREIFARRLQPRRRRQMEEDKETEHVLWQMIEDKYKETEPCSSPGGVGIGGLLSGFVNAPPPPNQTDAAEVLPIDATNRRREEDLVHADNQSEVNCLPQVEASA